MQDFVLTLADNPPGTDPLANFYTAFNRTYSDLGLTQSNSTVHIQHFPSVERPDRSYARFTRHTDNAQFEFTFNRFDIAKYVLNPLFSDVELDTVQTLKSDALLEAVAQRLTLNLTAKDFWVDPGYIQYSGGLLPPNWILRTIYNSPFWYGSTVVWLHPTEPPIPPDTWMQLTAGSPLQHHSMATVGSELYVFGGLLGSAVNTHYKYNIATDTWSTITTAITPPPRYGHKAVVVNGKIYVICGHGTSSETDDNWVYDPAANTWAQLANGPTGRVWYGAAVIGDLIYINGGYTSVGASNEMWVYNTTNDTWQRLIDSPVTMNAHSLVAIGDTLYAYGGLTSTSEASNIPYIYNTVSNTWSTLTPGPIGIYSHAAVSLNEKMYVFGGYTATVNSDALYRYDPVGGSWTTLAKGPGPRGDMALSLYKNRIYLYGGFNHAILDDLWFYNP